MWKLKNNELLIANNLLRNADAKGGIQYKERNGIIERPLHESSAVIYQLFLARIHYDLINECLKYSE